MIKQEDKIAVNALLLKLEQRSEKYPSELKEEILFWENKGIIMHSECYSWRLVMGRGYML